MQYTLGQVCISLFRKSKIFQNFNHFDQVLGKIAKMIKIEGFDFPENCIIVLPHCALVKEATYQIQYRDCSALLNLPILLKNILISRAKMWLQCNSFILKTVPMGRA